jgi:hypothetical protein
MIESSFMRTGASYLEIDMPHPRGVGSDTRPTMDTTS